jgi:hypothetical protein
VETSLLEEISKLALSVLEIVSQQRNVHILVAKGQLQEMSKITGQSLDDSEFEKACLQLEDKKLIKKIGAKKNTLILTPKGKEYLE